MRNRIPQPAPLDLPPVTITPIRIYGQLLGPMGQPLQYMTIRLKTITTTQQIVQDTWSETTTDVNGHYDFSVNPGKYAVSFERQNAKERVRNIQVYSDSAPGNLQSFMLAPTPDQLTPIMVLETKAVLQETTEAMMRSRQWAENPVDVPVLDFGMGAGPEYSAYHWAHKAQEMLDTDTNINWRGSGIRLRHTRFVTGCAGVLMETQPGARTTASAPTPALHLLILPLETTSTGH